MVAGFVDVFGGTAVYPSQASYIPLTISANTILVWPTEQQVGGSNIVAAIIDVDATTPGLSVSMPDARVATEGNAVLINNIGSETVSFIDAIGGAIISLVPGSQWFVYLYDNTTLAGLWRTYQLGATVSTANAAALAGAGLKAIGTTLNQTMPVVTTGVDRQYIDSDRAKAVIWNGGVGIFTLPDAAIVGADWFTIAKNLGSGNVTLLPTGSQTIDGSTNVVLAPGQSCFIGCDGMNFFTVGLTQSGAVGFDYTSIDVSGAGDYVLSGIQLNRIVYQFTGTLTGNRRVVVPGTIQQYWVNNATSGAFQLAIATSAQSPGVIVSAGQRSILYSDGTNVQNADTSNATFPIAITQGGTGSITASGALANLGAAPANRNIFTGNGLSGGGNLTSDRTLTIDETKVPLLSNANLFTSPNTFTSDTPSLITALATTVGYGGVQVSDELASRQLELLYLGDTTTPIYGAAVSSAVINTPAGTDLYISTGDTNRISIGATTGLVTIKNQLALAPGSAAAPSLAFSTDLTSGIWSSAVGSVIISAGGGPVANFQNASIQLGVVTVIASGTAATPSLAFSSSPSTGIFRSGPSNFGIATNGIQRINIDSSGTVDIAATSNASPGLVVHGPPGQYGMLIRGDTSGGNNYGLQITAGHSSADAPLNVLNSASTLNLFQVAGDGQISFGNVGQASTATAGGASALPALPAAYFMLNINGSPRKIACYN